MNRRGAIFTLAVLGAFPFRAQSQSGKKPARVTFLAWADLPVAPKVASYAGSPYLAAFKKGMRELGYVEGRDIVFDVHVTLSKSDPRDLAKELASLKTDVLFGGELSARAAQKASPSIPFVLVYSSDPVAGGFAKSLARPAGNVTGIATLNSDTSPKLLELLLTAVPKLSRVAVLANPTEPSIDLVLKNLRGSARQANVELLVVEARSIAEIDSGFARIAREKAKGVVVLGDPLIFQARRQIADLALKHKIASVYPAKEHVEAGGLISYGVSLTDGFRRAATFVDRILKGAKPGDLPMEQATTLELAVNFKTARALGLAIPQSLLVRADRVIE